MTEQQLKNLVRIFHLGEPKHGNYKIELGCATWLAAESLQLMHYETAINLIANQVDKAIMDMEYVLKIAISEAREVEE